MSSKPVRNLALKVLQDAFRINVPSYKEISPIAGKLKISSATSSANKSLEVKPLFINKDMQSLTMEDVRRLILCDSKYKGVKFNLFTDDKRLSQRRIHFMLRLLLNNGMTFTIHYNNGHQVMNVLNDISESAKAVEEQVYVEATRRENETHGETVLFQQVDVNPKRLYSRIPFTVNDDLKLEFLTPSLAILPRLQGLGIHKSHSLFEKLINASVSIKGIKPESSLKFFQINDEHVINDATSDIIGLFPHHIKSHYEFLRWRGNVKYAQPGKLIKFEGQFLTVLEVSDLMALKFPQTTKKFIEVIPYVATNYYSEDGKRLTKVLNSHVVFDSTKNESIEFDPTTPNNNNETEVLTNRFYNQRMVKDLHDQKKPFHRVSFREVLEFINFKNAYKYEKILGFPLDSDILRSYLMNNNHYLQLSKMVPIHNNLETLTFICEKWGNVESQESSNKSLEFETEQFNQMDMFLLHGYNKLVAEELTVAQFTNLYLINYMLYSNLVQDERSVGIFNFIFLRFINNEVRQHYPSFYNYYRIKFEEMVPGHANKPYKFPKDVNTDKHEQTLFKFIQACHSQFQEELPPLYNFKLFIKSKRKSFPNDKYKQRKFILQMITKFNGPEFKLPDLIHSQEIFFQSENAIIYKYIPLSRIQLIHRLKQLQFSTIAGESLEDMSLRIRLILSEDLERLDIRDNFHISFIEDLISILDLEFIKEYEEFDPHSESLEEGDKSKKVIEDYETKINPFVNKSHE